MAMSSLALARSASEACRFSLARAYSLGICSPVKRGMLVLTERLVLLFAGVVVLGVDVDGVVLARLLVGHGGLRAAPAPALAGAAVERRQAGPLGCVHVHAALLGLVGRLADVDVMLYGVVDAAFQRPALLRPGGAGAGQDEKQGQPRSIYTIGIHLCVLSIVGYPYCSFSPLRMRSVVVMPSLMAMRMPSLMPTRTGRRSNCCPPTLSVRT